MKRIKFRKDLLEWLEEHGSESVHRDIEGGFHVTVIEIPYALRNDFWSLYNAALCNDAREAWNSACPADDEVWDVVTGATEPTDGPYSYRMRGYDFDGFYEEGAHGTHDCKQYVAFHRATVCIAHWPEDHPVLLKDTYADGTPSSYTIIAFMDK